MDQGSGNNNFFDKVLVLAFLLSLLVAGSMLSRTFGGTLAAPGAGVTPSTSFGKISLGMHGRT